jgi:hypothetical protein
MGYSRSDRRHDQTTRSNKGTDAETVRVEAGKQRQHAAGKELLRTQGWLEYGVLLTAVGGLAVRFANEGFQFIEDYAVRLRQVQAVFSPEDPKNNHIRVRFVAVTGAEMPAELSTQIELDLQTSEGDLVWRVTGLHVEHPLETSMEIARRILLKLTEVSDRFDSGLQ